MSATEIDVAAIALKSETENYKKKIKQFMYRFSTYPPKDTKTTVKNFFVTNTINGSPSIRVPKGINRIKTLCTANGPIHFYVTLLPYTDSHHSRRNASLLQ